MPPRKRLPLPPDPVETRTAILNVIAAADQPVSPTYLGSLPGLSRKLRGTQVSKLLAEDLEAGRIFLWGTKKTPAFWHKDPRMLARERLLEISATQTLTSRALTQLAGRAAPKPGQAVLNKVRIQLTKEGLLREVKPKRFVNTQHPESYLQSEIAALLAAFGIAPSPERIQALFADHEPREPHPPSAASTVPEADAVRDAAEKIYAAMNRIAFSPGTTVTFYRLHQQPELASIPKATFDRAALLLQAERRALLSIHDHAAALPPAEQKNFVTDGHGKFYVSIYAR